MALDGLVLNSIVCELTEKTLGGRIDKIYQPEKDEIIFNIRSFGNSYKLMLTANSSHPRIHFTKNIKNNPSSPPMFCMILRKYINGGKITKITQPNFERIIFIHIESLNEMGDKSEKKLIIEIMGKHSNIILVDENDIVLDSIKRVNFEKSSVREILPKRNYVLPPDQNKINPLEITQEIFLKIFKKAIPTKVHQLILNSFSGISPTIANEICFLANIDPSSFSVELKEEEILMCFKAMESIVDKIKNEDYSLNVIYDSHYKLNEFSVVELNYINYSNKKYFDSPSELIEYFYTERDKQYRLNQKSADIKKILQSSIERYIKKIDIQQRSIDDCKNMDKYKVKGELITANIYKIEKGMKEFTCENFYSENLESITIKLNENLTPAENAQDYFKKYNKKKRTKEQATIFLEQNISELNYLESIFHMLHAVTDESDISAIREELEEIDVIKKKKFKKGPKAVESKPLHFISSDGFDIFVGKNNKQNDELTLRVASNEDIWMHTKEIPGSHVIIKTNGKAVPERTLDEGANIAGFYSKGKNSSTVPVDYTEKKNVKKPRGAKPGMVIYTTNKTAYVTPTESLIRKLKFNSENDNSSTDS